MGIYVDELYDYGKKGKWCHMASDNPNPEELHDFAYKIGLKHQWFQNHPLHPHYDLRPSMRTKAIKNGAIPVTRQQLVLKTSKFFNPSQ